MFSKLTKALILSGCLLAAGTAAANGRDVLVPVIAGAAVGAVIATAMNGDHHHTYYREYEPQPRYVTPYQSVVYVREPTRVEYRPVYSPPPRGYYSRDGWGHHGWGHDRGHDRDRDYRHGDRRW